MKIYTKSGDAGETSLFGGQRVSKGSLRIESYGTVDELNSAIGLARGHGLSELNEHIAVQCQNDLFILGADLATPPHRKSKIDRIGESHYKGLETFIDELDTKLEPLKFFILPAGSPAAASLHLARTICRRAERIVIRASTQEEISEEIVIYLNRLSDLLFTMARYENKEAGHAETKWKVR